MLQASPAAWPAAASRAETAQGWGTLLIPSPAKPPAHLRGGPWPRGLLLSPSRACCSAVGSAGIAASQQKPSSLCNCNMVQEEKRERGLQLSTVLCFGGGEGEGGLWRAAFPQYIALKSPWGGISDANGASLLPLYTVCSGTCCKTAPVLPLLRFKEQKEKGSVLWQCREGGS